MDANKVSLESTQKSLDDRGLRDVKFFFHNVRAVAVNDFYYQVAYTLHTYTRGDCTKLSSVDKLLKHI